MTTLSNQIPETINIILHPKFFNDFYKSFCFGDFDPLYVWVFFNIFVVYLLVVKYRISYTFFSLKIINPKNIHKNILESLCKV